MSQKLTWKIRIARAKKRGYFIEKEWNLSYGWCTCAISEVVPIEHSGKKGCFHSHNMQKEGNLVRKMIQKKGLSGSLMDWGARFYEAILFDDFRYAGEILEEIHALGTERVGKLRPA